MLDEIRTPEDRDKQLLFANAALSQALDDVQQIIDEVTKGSDEFDRVAAEATELKARLAELEPEARRVARANRRLEAQVQVLTELHAREVERSSSLSVLLENEARVASDYRSRLELTSDHAAALERELTAAQMTVDQIDRLEQSLAERDVETSALKNELAEWLETADQLRLALVESRGALDSQRVRSTEQEHQLLTRLREMKRLLRKSRVQNVRLRKRNSSVERLLAEERSARDLAEDDLRSQLEDLRGQLSEARESSQHWHGRNEALEVLLGEERAMHGKRVAELTAQMEQKDRGAEELRKEFEQLTIRFKRLANVELERTQAEIMHLSAAIDEIQSGRVWKLKRFLRRLLRRDR